MRYVRWGVAGEERPGVLDPDGQVRDLSGIVDDLSGPVLADLPAPDPDGLPRIAAMPRLGPPVASVGKLIGIGLNYTDHAQELGMPLPQEPIVFMKATSAICGPDDNVILPPGADKADWEVELGIVIGRHAKSVPEDQALAHVAGYTIINDISERGWQFDRGGQWVKGKSADTFAPVGPWLVTPDELDDVQSLELALDLNGAPVQRGTTARMIFPVARIVSYLSTIMSLQPGDLIATGTPPGVGTARTPPLYLRHGDDMRLRITGLGQQHQRVVQAG
ncbi:MAG: fumarylacetoacetate hydrolase family protein [Pseudomonadota bacterium]